MSRAFAAKRRREHVKVPLRCTRESLSAEMFNRKLFHQRIVAIEERRKRQIRYDEPKHVPAILKFRLLKHKELAVQYARVDSHR